MSKSMYAQRMARLSARIFGEVARPTDRKSMRVVKLFSEEHFYKQDDVVNYYITNEAKMDKLFIKLREYGLYRDDHYLFKEAIKESKRQMGKTVKPKKGEGKQALKNK